MSGVAEVALSMRGVRKSYGRLQSKVALAGLDLAVPTGSICAFIGPNGAGKTTAFSVVCGYLRPDAGQVDILGEGPFEAARFKGRLGVLPQDAELGLRHTPLEFLEHLGRLQGMSGRAARSGAKRLLERLNLGDRERDYIGVLSHGMRRRVAVASALLGEPELVLLDEPMSGLDPEQVASLRSFLGEQRGRRTLLISSHNLAELDLLCDHTILLDRGRCTFSGPIGALTGRDLQAQWLLGPGLLDLSVLRAQLPAHSFELVGELLIQEAPSAQELDASSLVIAGILAAAGIPIRELRRGKSLERGYLEASRESISAIQL